MDTDDRQSGRVLTRRGVLAVLGWSGASLLAGRAAPRSAAAAEVKGDAPRTCVITPEQTEGPYYVEARLNRSDIRSDPLDGIRREGVPLVLAMRVLTLQKEACLPLNEAMVDIWQCDAEGIYSDVRDARFNTVGKRFLRGYQLSDPDGRVRFTTIYPGWYPGRAVHIHFKVRVKGETRGYALTSQFYFDDTVTDRVHALAPYSKKGLNRTRNADDGPYRRGGKELTLAVTETKDGFAASYDIALKLD
jgi:protocatechuate 3,4-dioxygenase beta subunit